MPANKPYIIGLTGGIGCGKSEAGEFLASLGACHIDTDVISHALTAPGGEAIDAIREQFGSGVLDAAGGLDRIEMGRIIFSSEPHRRALEGILHPLIQRDALRRIDEAGKRGVSVAVLEVPLLFESGMDVLCDETWTMTAGYETQLVRVMARGFTEEEAEKRIASQMTPEARASRATHVIDTDRPAERTREELAQLYRQALRRRG